MLVGEEAGRRCPGQGRLTCHPACQCPQVMVGRVQAHTDAKGMEPGESCGTARGCLALGVLAPPGQGEEQCIPWASPVPHLAGITHHLQGQQHRGPLSAATFPQGHPPSSQPQDSREEGARPRGSAALQQPEVPGALLQDIHKEEWGQGPQRKGSPPREGHCLRMRESPAHPFLKQLCALALTSRLDSPMGGFPQAPGSHHALSPGLMAQAFLGNRHPSTAGAPLAGTMPWATSVSMSGV